MEVEYLLTQYYNKMLCEFKQKALEDYKSVLRLLGGDTEDVESCFIVRNGEITLNIFIYAKLLGYPEELEIPQWVDIVMYKKDDRRR